MKYSSGVEARVGDIVRYNGSCLFIYSVHEIDGDGFWLSGCSDIQQPRDFTLLHRPFQVGDPVIAVGGGEKACVVIGEETDRIKNTLSINDIHLCDSCVHENPLWRDHKDYVKELK